MSLESLTLGVRAAFKLRFSRYAPVTIEIFTDGGQADCLSSGKDELIGFTNGTSRVGILPRGGTVITRDSTGKVTGMMSAEKYASCQIKLGDNLVVSHTIVTGIDLQHALHRPTERVLALNGSGPVPQQQQREM
ncbi:MAG: hypothetical protein HY428_02695 [Candidatus Levybacteria bacterium]|nr:hypothetical protein [Candidatus Levybacteria bacterium]